MSLPPLDPDKTAAGIVVDPRTLERVVPSSKRRDGTVRKELKIRPGFTPQEDVGRFRGTRQQASDATKGHVPGSNRLPASKAANPDNPFAEPVLASASKSKAQLKNEKRREKKRAESSAAGGGVSKAWDESEDDESAEGGLKEAFEAADRHQLEEKGDVPKGAEVVGSEVEFPPLGGKVGGGAPAEGVQQAVLSTSTGKEEGASATADIPAPPPAASDVPETAASRATGPGATSLSVCTPKGEPSWRSRPAGKTPSPSPTSSKPSNGNVKSHPIQGGRQGPIGLAHPPPLPSQSKSQSESQFQPRGASGRGTGKSTPPGGPGRVTPPAAAAESRVRKEVRVREGGANDMSSLAARVKNLVVANQASPRERRERTPGAEGESA